MATKKGESVMDWENAADSSTPTVFYRTLNVEELEIFYREAGPWDAPAVLLLHGLRRRRPIIADGSLCGRSRPSSPQIVEFLDAKPSEAFPQL